MPLAPFATLRASVNGASVVTGGITCAGGETIVLSADPAGALTSFKIEIYDYPPEWALPSGWTSVVDAVGKAIYTCTPSNGIAPIFTLDSQAHWWKYMFRLTGNNGDNGGNKNIPKSQLIDERTAITVPAASGMQQVGRFESNQFLPDSNAQLQKNLRIVDSIASSAASSTAKSPAALLGTANLTLSGEQTIDGTLTSGTRVLLIAQSTSSQNGLWITAAGAWARPSDFNVDAQVVTGQTIFITGGSINQKTNWQLTSGSTIAGAKTYAQLVSGSSSSVLQPVDAVATTNNALSGTTAIDGVTLTANTSRVLAVAQTTSSQNGPWLVQAGAWTRPTDFTVDAQVVAGQTVYVKSGSLGTATTWQLTAGSAIGGAKTYAKTQLTRHNPVRLVQTTALPAYGYSSGVITASSNAALIATAFDGIGPATASPLLVGDRVLVVLEGTANGLYTVTQLGDGSHPYILTRATDLNITAQFVGGVQVDVLDGATAPQNQKATRWGMTTLGAVTLDTTATTWGPISAADNLHIDLSKPPYNVRGFTSGSAAQAATAAGLDNAGQINKAILDATAVATTLTFPVGYVPIGSPIFQSDNVLLDLNGCTLIPYRIDGGHMIQTQAAPAPTIGGTLVDTAANSTPLAMFDTAAGVNWVEVNLTHAGVRFGTKVLATAWSAWRLEMLIRFDSLSTPAAHVLSCRGRRNANQGVGHDLVDNLFSVYQIADQLQFKLRTIDVTAGVYGAITHTGTGTSVWTGDGTLKPSNDKTITVKVLAGGTIGSADSKAISYTLNGVTYTNPILLGTATSFTFVASYFTCKFNFAAGTLVAGDTYACTTSGVNQTTTLITPPASAGLSGRTVIAPGVNYYVTWQFDGSFVTVEVSTAGNSTRDPGAGTTGGTYPQKLAATGVVQQKAWEELILGNPVNGGPRESYVDGPDAHWYLGSIKFDHTAITPSTPVPTTIAPLATVSDQQFYWRPSTGNQTFGISSPAQLLSPDGATVWGWRGSLRNQFAMIVCRRGTQDFMQNAGVINGTIDGETNGAARNVSGIIADNSPNGTYANLFFIRLNDGLELANPCFYSHLSNLKFSNCSRIPLSFSNVGVGVIVDGLNNIDGGEIPLLLTRSAIRGKFSINLESELVAPIVIDNWPGQGYLDIELDDENVSFGPDLWDETIRIGVQQGGVCKITGNIGFGGVGVVPIRTVGGNGATTQGTVALDEIALSAGHNDQTSCPCWISALDADSPFAVLGKNVVFGQPGGSTVPSLLCDRPGIVTKFGSQPAAGADLADSNETLTWTPTTRTRRMQANVLSANRTKTLSTTVAAVGPQEGDEWSFPTLSQASFTLSFTNGGPAGGTTTFPALYIGTPVFRFNGTDWLFHRV